jgi:hypothetical protein
VFVTVTGSVALDPAVNRLFVRLVDSFQAPPPTGGLSSVTHDLTSIAVATLP